MAFEKRIKLSAPKEYMLFDETARHWLCSLLEAAVLTRVSTPERPHTEGAPAKSRTYD
jgi:hypothetical protein